jgi:hypothetical protein
MSGAAIRDKVYLAIAEVLWCICGVHRQDETWDNNILLNLIIVGKR